ncbi:grasp-with-spasm system ATP-grasp peptide maturase [[Flexibacter] sp. ATCC 35208]|uniref:grasp-with-spasm system ATP-grasp peptide maturase n=1 Tax=[Flexibacter] sp. ATCC 35208 TaxID=1936242 RepID=UPI0009D44223|nr:grasp-with-spasm system ATP-grasp peptide maturase [[Flexibacter] sp. ATCC 35208]OMP75295.1 grasp-with-spasm system ATP-grasp peptide maturase [[Flexibacter] sp. ATCC 35208]
MILVISHASFEFTTEIVMDWLFYLKANFIRINGNDLVENSLHRINIEIGNEHHPAEQPLITYNGRQLNLADINAIWYRRWSFHATFPKISPLEEKKFEEDINEFRTEEFKIISEIFFSQIKNKKIIGSPNHLKKNPSKYQQLLAAKKAGIDIPDTIITSSREELYNFYFSHHKRIIVKAMSEAGLFNFSGELLAGFTEIVSEEVINNLPDHFYPSSFQEMVEKDVELRVYYLEGKCYPMAIFSTLDKQTSIDFRKYNIQTPNRNVPFKIPDDLAARIVVLMNDLGLNTGSLDIILTTDGKFVFLEVNHGGQFGMVSEPCNYQLEKIVATSLIESDLIPLKN